LIAKLSFLNHMGRESGILGEIASTYKIPQEMFQDEKVQKWVLLKKKELIACGQMLNLFLHEIPALIKAKPPSAKWLVDYFGPAAKRYVPDHKKYDLPKAKKKADFQKAFRLFSRFLNGETPKNLGYTKQTYRNFTETVRPRGQIVLLYIVHMLLYGLIDSVEEEISGLVTEIKTRLSDSDPIVAREVLKRLFLEAHPEYDHETIIESVLKSQ